MLEVTVKFKQRKSLGVPDTSIMLEGNKAYVYKVLEDNSVKKIEIKIGSRDQGFVEILDGLVEGNIIVAEGLKKLIQKEKLNQLIIKCI